MQKQGDLKAYRPGLAQIGLAAHRDERQKESPP